MTPTSVDLVIESRWTVPVEPSGLVLTDHAVVINNGIIVEVLPSAEARNRYRPAETVTLPEHVLIPGLINSHTHAPMTLLRGIDDDLPLHVWLEERIWPAERKWVSSEFIHDGTSLAVAEMLSGGVTCFADMYFFPVVAADCARSMGMRMVCGEALFDGPTNSSLNPQQCLERAITMHESLASSDDTLITLALTPHAPYTVSDDLWRQVAELADELDVPVHTHLHETALEVRESLSTHGERPTERLANLGVVTDRLVAAHMTQLSDSDVNLLTEAGAHIVHCPESNLKLASGFGSVHRMTEAGINVALGTDGAASNNDLDMLGEMRTAALLAKAVSGDAAALPAPAALRMATLAGAQAYRIADRVGSIEVGKQADLTAVDLSAIACQPVYDPITQLVYTATRDQVTDVWVQGKRKLSSRELVGVDLDQLRSVAEKWRDRLSRR
ncbi:MAG: TRZ/ATZ family hydrolase [Actinomycetes bacterium]